MDSSRRWATQNLLIRHLNACLLCLTITCAAINAIDCSDGYSTPSTAVQSIRHKWFAEQIGAASCVCLCCALLSQSDAQHWATEDMDVPFEWSIRMSAVTAVPLCTVLCAHPNPAPVASGAHNRLPLPIVLQLMFGLSWCLSLRNWHFASAKNAWFIFDRLNLPFTWRRLSLLIGLLHDSDYCWKSSQQSAAQQHILLPAPLGAPLLLPFLPFHWNSLCQKPNGIVIIRC